MFQVVDGDAIIDAVHCARRFEQSLEERKRQIFFTDASVDQREVAIHNHAVNGIFRLRLQFDRAAALPDRVLFAPHKRVEPAQVSMPNSAQRRLFGGVFKNRSRVFKIFLRSCDITLRQGDGAFKEAPWR